MTKLRISVVGFIFVISANRHFFWVNGAGEVSKNWEQGRVQSGRMRKPWKIAITNQAIKMYGAEILHTFEHVFQFAELVLWDYSLGYVVEHAFVNRIQSLTWQRFNVA